MILLYIKKNKNLFVNIIKKYTFAKNKHIINNVKCNFNNGPISILNFFFNRTTSHLRSNG
jgi:hypothetical protein